MKKSIALISLLFFAINIFAQNIGIGTTNPLSKFSIGSSSQFQVDSIGNIKKINNVPYSFPSTQGNNGQVLINNGSGSLNWQTISSGSSGWGLTGNSGTNADSNFIGTTDSVGLVFKVNNAKAGLIDPNFVNTFYGLRSGNFNTTGSANTANGYQSLYSNTTGGLNTANGFEALFNNSTGYYNSAFGEYSLYSNTSGNYNTALGSEALFINSSGSFNTAIGMQVLNANTVGANNTASG